MSDTKQYWIGWLQERVPELKLKSKEFWLEQAFAGCIRETLAAQKAAQKAVTKMRKPNKQQKNKV